MNTSRIKTLFAVIALLLGATSAKAETLLDDDSMYPYSGNFHKEVVEPQVKAWQEVAKVIFPHFTDDTEGIWAAEKADSIGNAILANPTYPKARQMAMICQMQNYISYGMGYVAAIFGSYINPELSAAILQTCQTSKQAIDSLSLDNFRSPRLLTGYEFNTYFHTYFVIDMSTSLQSETPEFVDEMAAMCDDTWMRARLVYTYLKDPVQAFRYNTILSSTCFFMVYCPMTFWIGGEDITQPYGNDYYNMGLWYDKQAEAVNNAINDETLDKLPAISDEEFSAFLKQSAEYRATMVKRLAMAISSLPTIEDSNATDDIQEEEVIEYYPESE